MSKEWRDRESGNRWGYRVGDSGAAVSYVDDVTLKIPEKIEGHRVSAIACLGWHDHYAKVVIPEGVERIEGDVFDHFEKMEDFEVDAANSAFAVYNRLLCSKDGATVVRCPPDRCDWREIVAIPPSAVRIAGHAFAGCRRLRTVDFPKGVTTIGRAAFCDCRDLKKIAIPEGVRRIRVGTFRGCRSLGEVEIPSSVVSIKRDAFRGCESLASIVIPEGVRAIKGDAFSGCTKLTSVTLPKSLMMLSLRAFRNCPNLKMIVLPPGASKEVRCIVNAILHSSEKAVATISGTSSPSIEETRREDVKGYRRGCLLPWDAVVGILLVILGIVVWLNHRGTERADDSVSRPVSRSRTYSRKETRPVVEKVSRTVDRYLFGLFGMEFGTVMDARTPCSTNNAGVLAYDFHPATGAELPGFENYVAFATPKTHQVSRVRAVGRMKGRDSESVISNAVAFLEDRFERSFVRKNDNLRYILFENGNVILLEREGDIIMIDAVNRVLNDLGKDEAKSGFATESVL